ncbi:hypothetical protein B7463_g5169, partial [Scytalidium lignicola]
MAPDSSNLYTNGSQGNGGTSDRYEIPDVLLFDPKHRKIKVLTIGAGVSGIMMAYKIQKQCENVEHVIYEKNDDIGGTWLENRYPGCACDVPSHAYTFNFALNPEWSRYNSHSEEIWRYLDKVCEVFDFRKFMTFKTEVIGCYWDEDVGQWTVKLRTKGNRPGEYKEFEEKCDILLHGTGILNNYKWPDVEGLHSFKGKVIHTANWPKDYQEEQWKNESVAIIGSGSSSVQTLPTMQPYVKHIDTFVRTPIWFVPVAGNGGDGLIYTEDEKQEFRRNIPAMLKYTKKLETMINGDWNMFFKDSEVQKKAQELLGARMTEMIKDERLLKGYTPKFGVGCRRITPGDPYMRAIQQPNVDVQFAHVVKITEDSVVDSNGNSFKPDTIICATGFDVSYRPRFPVVGRNGVDLRDKWKVRPESYLGLSVPDIPNFITFIGPTFPVENGSVMGPLTQVGNYAVKMIKKMQTEFIHSFEPKQDVTDAFNEHTQELLKQTVWTDDCRAWYRDNETGRVKAVYPGSSLHYYRLTENPRYEDYNFKYQNKHNQWAFLGRGFTSENFIEGADNCPWHSEEFIDPKWLPVIESGELKYDNGNASSSDSLKHREARIRVANAGVLELEHLMEESAISDEQFDTIMNALPVETPLSGAGASRAVAGPAATPSSASSPTNAMARLNVNDQQQFRAVEPTPVAQASAPQEPAEIGRARALYRYADSNPNDCQLEPGDIISVYEHMNADWWMGKNTRTGKVGIFPRNYVDPVSAPPPGPPGGFDGGAPPPAYYDPKFNNGGYPGQPQYQQQQQLYGQQQPPPSGPSDPYNSSAPPMAMANPPAADQQQQPGGSKVGEYGKKFGKKLGNAAIFGAGATLGADVVNSIF